MVPSWMLLLALAAPLDPPPPTLWRFEAPEPIQPPLLLEDHCLVLGDNTLWALDPRTGAERWKAGSYYVNATMPTPTTDGERLFLNSPSGVAALRASDGRFQWDRPLSIGGAGGVAVEAQAGRVCFASGNGLVHCHDAKTGKEAWAVEATEGEGVPAARVDAEEKRQPNGRAAPGDCAIANGRVLAAFRDQGRVFSIRVADGGDRQFRQLPAGIASGPVIEGGHAMVGLADGKVVALDLESLRPAWSFKATDALGGNLAAAHGLVFGATTKGQVLALRAKDGSLAWQAKLARSSGQEGFDLRTGVLLDGDRVWAWQHDGVVAGWTAATGRLVLAFRSPASDAELAGLAVDGKRLYLAATRKWDSGKSMLVGQPALLALSKP